MPTEAEVRAALDAIIHPTYGMSLIALQMVHAIRLFPGRIEVDLAMNCSGCASGQAAIARVQQALKTLGAPGGAQVVVKLSAQMWEPPWHGLGAFS